MDARLESGAARHGRFLHLEITDDDAGVADVHEMQQSAESVYAEQPLLHRREHHGNRHNCHALCRVGESDGQSI